MGVISNKPMICKHCLESDLDKLVTVKGVHKRICRKCQYSRRKKNSEIGNEDEVRIDKVKGFCVNGCQWWRWIKYERGTKPETRLLCPDCKRRDDGTMSRGGALPDHGRNNSDQLEPGDKNNNE